MKRIVLTVGLIAGIGALAYYVLTHPSRDRVDRLRADFEALREKNEQLEDENEQLRREIVALRNDPRLAERRARTQAGLARPGEVILQFEGEGGEDRALQVDLKVEPERLRIAGETVRLERLDERLEQLREELPDAELEVEFADDLGALRRERVIDIVDESAFAPSEFRAAAK